VFKVEIGGAEFGVEGQTGTADSGILESDLPEVFMTVANAAKEAGSAITARAYSCAAWVGWRDGSRLVILDSVGSIG
jgi:hypothetical protein